MEAEKRHVPMIASAYMNICRNSYMSVEDLRRVEGNYYHYMPYLSRSGYYAYYHPVTKILEDHITSSTKTGTEERKLLVEKRDYTFRLTPLMCAVLGLINLDGENNAGGGFKHDYKQDIHLLLKNGANPFAKDITEGTVIHYATHPAIRRLRTPTLLEIAKMCIDAGHHYSKAHKIVILQGLTKVEPNGRHGYCGWYDTFTGRLGVYLYGSKNGSTVLLGSTPCCVKPDNIISSTNKNENKTTSCDESHLTSYC